ncbi:hypothetical protein SANTM175S_02129 [Streptomyces antimycoticus]
MLLSALSRVLHRWTGRARVPVDVEGHGREELFADLDLSRTVGWFTTRFPVALDLPDGGWGAVLKSVKEQMRAVPRRGLATGGARDLLDGGGLPDGPTAGDGFNYLGRFEAPGRWRRALPRSPPGAGPGRRPGLAAPASAGGGGPGLGGRPGVHLVLLRAIPARRRRSPGCREFREALCDSTGQLVVALLAVVKAGGVYVPLDTRAPEDRPPACWWRRAPSCC